MYKKFSIFFLNPFITSFTVKVTHVEKGFSCYHKFNKTHNIFPELNSKLLGNKFHLDTLKILIRGKLSYVSMFL